MSGALDRQAHHAPRPGPLRGLPLDQQTVPALLERQAGAYGDKPLLRGPGAELSYRGVRDAAAAAAGVLSRGGVRAGDRVAVMCANRLELMELVLGCAWLGALVVPLNTALRGPQLAYALNNSGARLLVADSELVDRLEVVDPPAALEQVWALDGVPTSAPAGYPVDVPPPPGEQVAAASVGPGDTMAILYTSGTTGPSKGVCCPHAQFYWWGINMSELLEVAEDDVLFTTLPMFHTNALNAFFQALVAGATYAFAPRFSASRFWAQAAEADGTVTYLLGAMVNILAAARPAEADRAHRLRLALAPATPARLHKPFRDRFGVQLVEGFGATETNGVMGVPPDAQRPGYLGLLLEGFDAVVADGHDAPVPDGTPGELLLRHREPYAFATGYFEMPEKTVEAWRNLWFHTGDRVVREPDGWYRFLDRIKDAIRRRGENISSFEVEQAILEHPVVAGVAVFPVPSELAEDEVMAAVVLEDEAVLDPIELMQHCELRLAYFAIPRYIDVVDELPVTENGKVRKTVLRERGVTDRTWDREAAGYVVKR